MKGVILAAGDGGRLRPMTLEIPKALLDVGGRPLIHYALDAMQSSGVSDIAVVVGYKASKIMDALRKSHPQVEFVYNADYDGENALSVYAARSFLGDEPFLLCMGDHHISLGIVQSLVDEYSEGCVLCVDTEPWHPTQLGDATRVMVDSKGYISNVGKDLDVWNAVDTGVFQMTGDVFTAVERLARRQGVHVGISDVMRQMAAIGSPFAACDVGGMFWWDVDTPEDYEALGAALRDGN